MKTLVMVVVLVAGCWAQDEVPNYMAFQMVYHMTCHHGADTEKHKGIRKAQLGKWNLKDSAKAEMVLEGYCKKFDDRVKEYNDSDSPDRSEQTVQDFQRELFELTKAVTVELMNQYPDEFDKIVGFIGEEKAAGHMGVVVMPEMPGMSGAIHRDGGKLVNAQWVNQQMSYSIGYGYYAYMTEAWDYYQVWATGLIQGSSGGSWGCQWDSYHQMWQPPGCPATHTPSMTLALSGGAPNPYNFQQSFSGGGYSPSQYINWSEQLPTAPGWNAYGPSMPSLALDGIFQVNCSIAGIIASWHPHWPFITAYTRWYVGSGACSPIYDCTPATNPPLFGTTSDLCGEVGMIPRSYWDGWTLCGYGSDGHYHCPSLGYYSQTQDGSQAACTAKAGH